MNATTRTPGARRGKLAVGVSVALGLVTSVGLQCSEPAPTPAEMAAMRCVDPLAAPSAI